MLAKLIVAFLLAPGAAMAASGSAEDWTPFRAFMGTWNGVRTASNGKVSVTRRYESVAANQHLLATERVSSDESPWGVVSFDAGRGSFVLRRFSADGNVAELVLEAASSDATTMVFATSPANGGPGVERITDERRGWNE